MLNLNWKRKRANRKCADRLREGVASNRVREFFKGIGRRKLVFALAPIFVLLFAVASVGQTVLPTTLSFESKNCIQCHKEKSPGLYQQWGESKHYRANVGCYECHQVEEGDTDAVKHYDHMISTIVSPKDCARCHVREAAEFAGSHHAKAGRILGSLDNLLAEVVEGNRGMKTAGFPEGISAAAVNGCWQCHGSEIKVLTDGTLDPATYPNSGIGRINPDGSEGSCNACHTRHSFSAAQARHPDTCGKCHLGPDHPQKEIYEESKHGISFFANIDKMNLDSAKWIVGEDYWSAPTCATCHMSATKEQDVTHDIGMRISWNNRPVVSIRPEDADAKMDLPGKNVRWQTRRAKMMDVCVACHSSTMVNSFYIQYDALIDLYNEKYAKPTRDLVELAKPLRKYNAPFSDKIDWIWFELWHHEGRRARHGASMMAPDYTHWHGTYEMAKHLYMELYPELQSMVDQGLASKDPLKVDAAKQLAAGLAKVINNSDNQWSVDKTDPAELKRREKAREDFLKRYKKQ